MECSCVRQTDLPNTSKLFADLVYHFERVQDLYPWAPNNLNDIAAAAAQVSLPDDRRAAMIRAIRPLNDGNPALDKLALPGTVAVVTGQQAGLFSGPAYSVYKALTAIRIAADLEARGVPAVPVFWVATEDHDFAEIDHVWVFGGDHHPTRLKVTEPEHQGPRPVGGVPLVDIPLEQLRQVLSGLPFGEEAYELVARAYQPGETVGSAFIRLMQELFAPWGLLFIDPMTQALRDVAAPLLREVVLNMGDLTQAVISKSRALQSRGYHAQVLVDSKTSLVFLLEDGKRLALRRGDGFSHLSQKWSAQELADRAEHLSPNALLRPVVQDYFLPTAAYVGGPAELAYLAQSRPLYETLLGRQPVAFPRTGFTLADERLGKRMGRYGLVPQDLFVPERDLYARIAKRLIPSGLQMRIDQTNASVRHALDLLGNDLAGFDKSMLKALDTSRRKIEYQAAKIGQKTATQMMRRDEQAQRDAHMLYDLVFPHRHLQERLYSIVPMMAKFGPGLIADLYSHVQTECPDHQFAII